jgi:phage repressor protein C with HTH and peptisase S24 domain
MAAAEESAIYRELMRFKPDGLSPNAWAVRAGVSRTVWSDMRRHGNPSRRTLEKLLAAAGSTLAEFEALRIGDSGAPPVAAAEGVSEGHRRGWIAGALPPLPVLDTRLKGEWGDPGSGIEIIEVRRSERIDTAPRPPSLAADRDAFAITVVGDSMWPRFRPGRRVAVSPRSPVAIGDDVLVSLSGKPGLSLLKELVRRTGSYVELRQFNPDCTFRVEATEVEAIEKVVGELI